MQQNYAEEQNPKGRPQPAANGEQIGGPTARERNKTGVKTARREVKKTASKRFALLAVDRHPSPLPSTFWFQHKNKTIIPLTPLASYIAHEERTMESVSSLRSIAVEVDTAVIAANGGY